MNSSAVLFDTNVWLALAFAAHPHHQRATEALLRLETGVVACFCRATQQSFLRLVTNSTFLKLCGVESVSNRDALSLLAGIGASPRVGYRDEPAGIQSAWFEFALAAPASPRIWMDAYLAAFALVGGMELVSFDRDFTRFAGVRVTVLGNELA